MRGDVLRGNLTERSQTRDVLEFLPQRFAAGKAFRICHQARAHRAHGLIFVFPFVDRELAMSLNQRPAFRKIRRREQLASREFVFDLLENPRRTHRCPADHHASDSSFRTPFRDIGGIGDVAVPDDRNADRGHDLADHLPIRRARVTLRARAAMHGDGGDSHIFENTRHGRRVDRSVIPANANLRRDRQRSDALAPRRQQLR